MRTIHASLLAEQKKAAYVPSLSLTVQDNRLAHPTQQFTTTFSEIVAAIATNSEIIQIDNPGLSVRYRRITDPEQSSQWTGGWTTLATGNSPAIFYTGSYIVVVYRNGTSLRSRRSSDGGLTWSIEKSHFTLPVVPPGVVWGVSGGATHSGFFYTTTAGLSTTTTKLNFALYQAGTDSFTPFIPLDYSLLTVDGFGIDVSGFSAIHDGGDNYLLSFVIHSSTTPGASVLYLDKITYDSVGGVFTGSSPHLYRVVHGSNVSAYVINHPRIAKINGNYWLTFFLRVLVSIPEALLPGSDYIVAFSDDGIYFTGGVKLGLLDTNENAGLMDILLWATNGAVYFGGRHAVYKSVAPVTVTADESRIIEYSINARWNRGRVSITLDNRDGFYNGLETGRLGADIVLERGAVVAGVARRTAWESFVLDKIRWLADNSRVELQGHSYLSLLSLWRADLAYVYGSLSLKMLVEQVAALAGVHSASFDSNTVWTKMVVEFTIQPGQSAQAAIQVLAEQYQFTYRDGGKTINCFILLGSPVSDYSFGRGVGEHPTFFVEDSSERTMPDITHALVIGDNVGGENIASALQTESGRQYSRRVTKRYISTDSDAAAAATAMVTRTIQTAEQAGLLAMPAFQLQPLDVVTSDGFLANQIRYISRIVERYRTGGQAIHWRQEFELAWLAGSAGGSRSRGSTVNPAIALSTANVGGTVSNAVKRGELISFDSATWTAIVRVEHSEAAVSLPVGRWITAGLMVTGVKLAVLFFDESNPNDGLVVGPYTGSGLAEYGARVYNSAIQTISTHTWTVLTFDLERWDDGGFHSTTTNISRLTAPVAGHYLISGFVSWDLSGGLALEYMTSIILNGITQIADLYSYGVADVDRDYNISTIYKLAAGDYVELRVRHTRGLNLAVVAKEFSIVKV